LVVLDATHAPMMGPRCSKRKESSVMC
jgi:hypothetical protein